MSNDGIWDRVIAALPCCKTWLPVVVAGILLLGGERAWSIAQEGIPEPTVDPEIRRSLTVPAAAPRFVPSWNPQWDRFQVFVWQHQTDAATDWPLYEKLGIQAWHIDRGQGQERQVALANSKNMPYYVDHLAGKGDLHLTPATGLADLPNDGSLAPRPISLISRPTIDRLLDTIARNHAVVSQGPVLAYALDDEISLGSFNTPFEVDNRPLSVALYRDWLRTKYGDIAALNKQWGSDFASFADVPAVGLETLRRQHQDPDFSQWNLSPWIDWRSFMDSQFAHSIYRLTQAVRALDQASGQRTPVGFVGGQQPSAYGGFDYTKLSQVCDFMEAYDIGGTNEILTSFWSEPRRRIVQTFFATGDPQRDQWFLWYYWAHGNSGVIAWPNVDQRPWFADGKIDPQIQPLSDTFARIQAPALQFMAKAQATRVTDPVAILYSHPSIQASWVADISVHGSTWPRRSSSLDNACQSAGKNRIAWSKILEDCGVQSTWITCDQLEENVLQTRGVQLLILPRAMALSEKSITAIKRFTHSGGVVLADHWTAVLDDHGKGRVQGGLDDLFSLTRDSRLGHFDGQTIAEINGERYQSPLAERLPTAVLRPAGLMQVERGTVSNDPQQAGRTTVLRGAANPHGTAASWYLNLSPTEYVDPKVRRNEVGQNWRRLVQQVLASAAIVPRVRITSGEPGQATDTMGIESLLYQVEGQSYLILVANPTREAAVDTAGEFDLFAEAGQITLQFRDPVSSLINVFDQQEISVIQQRAAIPFLPQQASVYRLVK